MKKVLLTTTAVALTAGMVSAGDMSMSGSISLTYGGFGTGTVPAADKEGFSSEADLDIAASSSSGSISVTGTLELDEDGDPATGPVTISSGGFSLTYDENDIGGLAQENTADGEDDNYGDYKIAYSAGGISFSYERDSDSSDNVTAVSYTAGALSLSMTSSDETQANASAGLTAGVAKTVIGASYVTGPYTISLSGDDQDTQEWDASVAMVSGDTTVTVAADEAEVMSVAVAYGAGSMSVSASQEFNGADDTTFGVSYTEGSLTFGAAYDSGNDGGYGDEAQLLLSASYTDGDVTVAAKGNDQDEMEVSVSFAF
jgi:hypothetical protein